jgi:DNA-directed RNA polymerase specialized sigma24 family protein
MFTIIRRHITDIRKSRKFRDDQLTIRTDDGFFGKGVSSTADQRYIAVDQIESIKNEQLRAVTKMLLAGMTYAEVAKELGVSVATIANRVSTIREIFRRRLTQS